MKTRFLSFILVFAFAVTTTATAQQMGNRKGNQQQKTMMMQRQHQMKKQFQNFFTEEQQAKMKELRLASAKVIKPMRNELNELRAKQKTLSTSDDVDLKAINKNIDQMSELEAGIKKIMAKQNQDIRAMLSDEQLLKYDSMKHRMGQRKGGFHGRQMRKMN